MLSFIAEIVFKTDVNAMRYTKRLTHQLVTAIIAPPVALQQQL